MSKKSIAIVTLVVTLAVSALTGGLMLLPSRDSIIADISDTAVCGEWTTGSTSTGSDIAVVKCDGDAVAIVQTQTRRGTDPVTVFVNGEEQPTMSNAEVQDLLDAYGVQLSEVV